LDAASPALLEHWLDDEVLPRLRPRTVVVAVASLDLNGAGAAVAGAREAYEEADATRPGTVGRVGAAAVEHSALTRHRRALRDPATIWDALGRAARGAPQDHPSAAGIEGVLGPDGQGRSRAALRYRGDPGAKAFTRSQFLADWRLDPGQLDALERLVRGARDTGADVVLVALPVTDDYASLHPGGVGDLDTALGAMAGVAERTGVPFVDLHDQQGDEAFADTHHLNSTGSTWFSRSLPGWLEGTAGASRRCPA
jgi:hypothetical protein